MSNGQMDYIASKNGCIINYKFQPIRTCQRPAKGPDNTALRCWGR